MTRQMVAFLVLFYLILNSANASAGYIYHPKGCEYQVTFPVIPNLTQKFAPGVGNVISAEYISKRASLMRAECFHLPNISSTELGTKHGLMKAIVSYGEANGFFGAEYSYEKTGVGSKATCRGYKTIDGIPVTYEVHMYVGDSSSISLYIGGPSSKYPDRGVIEFIHSIHRE